MPDEKKEFSRDSISNTLVVAIGVSLVCSVLVSAAAVVLRPAQERNQAEFKQRIVLEVAGLYEPDADIATQFGRVDARLVDLETGEYVDDIDPQSFDAVAAVNDAGLSVVVPAELDVANLRRRAIYAAVYLVADGDDIEQIILPVYGAGLWSTMRGFLAVEADGNMRRRRASATGSTRIPGYRSSRGSFCSTLPVNHGSRLSAASRSPDPMRSTRSTACPAQR